MGIPNDDKSQITHKCPSNYKHFDYRDYLSSAQYSFEQCSMLECFMAQFSKA